MLFKLLPFQGSIYSKRRQKHFADRTGQKKIRKEGLQRNNHNRDFYKATFRIFTHLTTLLYNRNVSNNNNIS